MEIYVCYTCIRTYVSGLRFSFRQGQSKVSKLVSHFFISVLAILYT